MANNTKKKYRSNTMENKVYFFNTLTRKVELLLMIDDKENSLSTPIERRLIYHTAKVVLQELRKKIKSDLPVELITTADANGRRAYRRSVVFMMQKALDNLYPGQNPDIHILHSLGEGYYCLFFLDGLQQKISEDFLVALKTEMKALCKRDIVIRKSSVPTRDAMEIFREAGMISKEHLLRYRSSSSINLYDLDGCKDYFYGYMAPSSGFCF